MTLISIAEIFGTMAAALGGYEGVKWLVSFFAHRKAEKRLKEAEAECAEIGVDKEAVAVENAMRDMYEETLAHMSDVSEHRIAEMRKDYMERIEELNKANSELHKQNLELLKAGARKDEIIEDKTVMIRKIQEQRVEDAKRIGDLEKKVQFFEAWKCYREFGRGGAKCNRREPTQNPPLKFTPLKP